MSAFWGQPTWFFLHTFAEKINSEYYLKHKQSVISLIKMICENLPCPHCRMHATQYMHKVNANSVQTKERLISMFIHFHNEVSQRLGKQAFNMDYYDKIYKKAHLNYAFENFQKTYGKRYTSILSRTSRDIEEENRRIDLTNRIFFFLKGNKNNFNSL
jgi:hypothetical protein